MSEEFPSDPALRFESVTLVYDPKPEHLKRMAIPRYHWDHLKFTIARATEPPQSWPGWCQTLLGFAGGTATTVLTLVMAVGWQHWATYACMAATTASLAIGGALWDIGKKLEQKRHADIADVLEEMKSIESMFPAVLWSESELTSP